MVKAADEMSDQVVQMSTVETKFRSALTDTDPGVVMTAIQVMKTVVALKASQGTTKHAVLIENKALKWTKDWLFFLSQALMSTEDIMT